MKKNIGKFKQVSEYARKTENTEIISPSDYNSLYLVDRRETRFLA